MEHLSLPTIDPIILGSPILGLILGGLSRWFANRTSNQNKFWDGLQKEVSELRERQDDAAIKIEEAHQQALAAHEKAIDSQEDILAGLEDRIRLERALSQAEGKIVLLKEENLNLRQRISELEAIIAVNIRVPKGE